MILYLAACAMNILPDMLESMSPTVARETMGKQVKIARQRITEICTDLKAFKAYYKSYHPEEVPMSKSKAKTKAAPNVS